MAAGAPPAKRHRRAEEEDVFRHAVTIRATFPAHSAAEKALVAWRLRQLREMAQHDDAEGVGGGGSVEDAPTADGGIAVGSELVAFPKGNYRADVDFLLLDGGSAKLEQSQAACAAITRLVRCFACLQLSLDEAPAVTTAVQLTDQALAAARSFLLAELEELPDQQPQEQPPNGGTVAAGSPAQVLTEASACTDCCPEGHKLEETTSTEPVGCDVCEEVLMEGGRTHTCRTCDYDCCDKCFALGKAGSTAVAEDSGSEDGELWKCTDGELWRGTDGSCERLLRDACTAIEELMSAAAPLSDLHRKIHLSDGQILTAVECQAAVQAAEAHAATHGWQTARHAAYATHDLPIEALGKGDARPKAESRVITDCVSAAIESKLIPQSKLTSI